MEQTQSIAAQRAEELRELEESRTAEHDAVEQREVRRQRREEGLPELTRGERVRERFSGFGETLSRPALLIMLFVVLLLVGGGIAYAVLNTSGDNGQAAKASGKSGGKEKQTAAGTSVKPDEIEVAVLNGTEATGLAATWGDKAEAKGFEVGAITNTTSTFENSVVMFENGAANEAKAVAKQLQIHKVQPMTAEVSGVSNGAKVSVVVGEDNAPAEG
jgi:hypothetical protein